MRLLFTTVVLIVQTALGACGASESEDLKRAVREVLRDVGACTVERLMTAEGENVVVVGSELTPESTQEETPLDQE